MQLNFLAMKFTILLLTLSGLAAIGRSHAQSISLSHKDAAMAQVFKSIEKQTAYTFVYTKAQLQKTKPVTLQLKSVTLTEALDACFQSQPLEYTIESTYIIVREKQPKESLSVKDPVPLAVSGTVRNETGDAVAGATVSVKGTTHATATDAQGNFILENIAVGDIISVSSVGYETLSLKFTGQRSLNIILQQKINELDQAVVIGYGTTSKRYNTGSVSKITASEIARQPVGNPLAALQGRATGVFVQTVNGLPGGNIKVQVRGQGSVTAGTDPLYIIDGVPFLSSPFNSANVANGANGAVSPFSVINPQDIESVEVLKDAEATAIYGSRGANGVVLITTKKGSSGKTAVAVNVYQGISTVSRRSKFLDLKQYLQVRREAFANAGMIPTAGDAPDLLVWDTTRSTDWQEYMFGGTGQLTNAQLDMSGGSGQTQFLMGGNFRSEGTMLPGNNNYTRGGGHLSVNHHSLDQKFSLDTRVMYTSDLNKVIYNADAATFVNLPPNYPLYNPDGKLNWDLPANPAALLLRRSQSRSSNLLANTKLKYAFTKKFSLQLGAGYGSLSLDRLATFPKQSVNPAYNAVSSALFANNKQESFILEPLAAYDRQWDEIKLSVMAGGTYQQITSTSESVEGTNYSNEALLGNQGAAGKMINNTNNFIRNRYVSGFARITGRWKDRYLLSLNFRRDGSTKFGPSRAFGNFGSAGAGWIFSNENFISHNIPWMSFGKLRLSYGVTGNDQIPDYAYLSAYGNGNVYNNQPGLSPQRIANGKYSWETTNKKEIGLETGFFKDRILFTAAFYHNKSDNQLIPYTLPSQTGFTSYIANLPAVVVNKGWEFSIQTINLKNNSLEWTSSFNITLPKNKLVDYPGLAASSYANTYFTGRDLSTIKLINYTGIDPSTGIPAFTDVDGDGQFTFPNDYLIAGKTSPDFFGGFSNTVRYKNMECSFFIQFAGQHSLSNFTYPGWTTENTMAVTWDRWTKPGDITGIPLPVAPSATPAFDGVINLLYSDYYFFNTTYFRLKNIELAWNANKKCRVYLQGQNVFTITGNRFIDPETLTVAGNAMPVMKQWIAGIRFTL